MHPTPNPSLPRAGTAGARSRPTGATAPAAARRSRRGRLALHRRSLNDGRGKPPHDRGGPIERWFCYVLECADGTLYTGITTSLDRRLSMHNRGLARSEEHTSELQSLAYLVCRLLLEKKKKYNE